jgi:muramoyltetrapeptide carboxypeptidase
MSKMPPYLKKGDTIAIVAPAGFMPIEKMQSCIETLDSWGYTIRLGATTHSSSSNYFSGSDDERLADLQEALDDPSVKAILCARGGYGTSRIIDRISFKKFRKKPKWIIGFSDITVLLCHLQSQFKIASLHAPMAGAFNSGEFNNPYLLSLKNALEGKPTHISSPGHPFNRDGEVKGQLIGGNLALLAHLCGTESEPKTKDRILFLEDIGEYLYNIDRRMIQLKRAGKLDKLQGLIFGRFTDNKDTERPFGKSVEDILFEHVSEYSYPVCFNFPVSHEKENYALKVGVKYHLSVKSDEVSLIEHYV